MLLLRLVTAQFSIRCERLLKYCVFSSGQVVPWTCFHSRKFLRLIVLRMRRTPSLRFIVNVPFNLLRITQQFVCDFIHLSYTSLFISQFILGLFTSSRGISYICPPSLNSTSLGGWIVRHEGDEIAREDLPGGAFALWKWNRILLIQITTIYRHF